MYIYKGKKDGKRVWKIGDKIPFYESPSLRVPRPLFYGLQLFNLLGKGFQYSLLNNTGREKDRERDGEGERITHTDVAGYREAAIITCQEREGERELLLFAM